MMSLRLWIGVNLIFLLISSIYIWLFQKETSSLLLTAQAVAQIALLLFIVNINMHFIFKVIKKTNKREVKVALAKLSRKMMKSHRPFALIATSLILIHAAIMISQLGDVIGFFHPKFLAGFSALLILSLTLLAGYLRHVRASGFRRKFHLTMAMIFGVAIILHIFIPI